MQQQIVNLFTVHSAGEFSKQIHVDIPYDDIYQSKDNLWNFLFFTGYMKKVSERQDPDTPEKLSMTMKIPNIEIRSIYNNLNFRTELFSPGFR